MRATHTVTFFFHNSACSRFVFEIMASSDAPKDKKITHDYTIEEEQEDNFRKLDMSRCDTPDTLQIEDLFAYDNCEVSYGYIALKHNVAVHKQEIIRTAYYKAMRAFCQNRMDPKGVSSEFEAYEIAMHAYTDHIKENSILD